MKYKKSRNDFAGHVTHYMIINIPENVYSVL